MKAGMPVKMLGHAKGKYTVDSRYLDFGYLE